MREFIIDLGFFVDSMLIFVLAFLLDVGFGEIPDRVHPTVWMGKVIGFFKSKARHQNPGREKLNGVFLCLGIILIFGGSFFLLLCGIRQIPFYGWFLYILSGAILLKTTFALSCMRHYTIPIAKALYEGRINDARNGLRYIVRRDPNKLDERHIISAAVESIAESTTDGITSPFFYFALFGVPGAFAFRVINTLDSMVGYKDKENVNIGWFSAKMDTIANYIPARITALLMVASATIQGRNGTNSWRILQRDRDKTASPNAGWTISAMAGALEIQLEKEGHYSLGDGKNCNPVDIMNALRIMELTAILFGFLIVVPILFAIAPVQGFLFVDKFKT